MSLKYNIDQLLQNCIERGEGDVMNELQILMLNNMSRSIGALVSIQTMSHQK